jgi:small-conductance mechanosensitive channel
MANQIRRLSKTLFFIILIFFCWGTGGAEEELHFQTEPAADIPEYSNLKASIENTLKIESENVAKLEKQLADLKASDKNILAEINAYKIQLSNYTNLLVSPKAQVEDIEKAWANTKAALTAISERLKDLTQKRAAAQQLLEQTMTQYDLNVKQLLEMNTDVSNVSETQALVEKLQALIRRLSEKIKYLEEFQTIYTEHIVQLEAIRKAFTDLSENFDQQIQAKKKEELFKRKERLLLLPDWQKIIEEIKAFIRQIRLPFSNDFWLNTFRGVWKATGIFPLISCLLLFGLIQFLLFRLRGYLFYLTREHISPMQYPWRHLILQLLQRSLLTLGAALFIYAYANIRSFYSTVPFIRAVFYILLAQIFSRWLLRFLTLWNKKEKYRIPLSLTSRLQTLILMSRYFAVVYVITIWLMGGTSIFLFFERVFFEIALIIWGASFWKSFQKEIHLIPSSPLNRRTVILRHVILWLMNVIIGGGMILEFAGYGSLAHYWYASWACSAVSCLWGTLFFMLLWEWNKRFKQASLSAPVDASKAGDPIRWLFLQVCWLAWGGILIVCVLFAWGAKQAVIVGFFKILGKEVTVGGMRFSFLGFIYAFLILLCTHAAVRLWRHTLIKNILDGSGLGTGLKESIAIISGYLLWIFGILLSLNLVGVSATSLTVAFGALGIGLGFGLQNIFNNFISGIILLFERPIQVGDAVEINGIWGEIRKINVRSTLIQTYDNATLIIPNSEFISSQVTNWSFNDPRIRRTITIGVAYGSDIELVRQTLLEIAASNPMVLKYPAPSVLFTDFGDSALIFKLRVWTDVDNCLIAETDIRFEADRLFRERKIQIPFPQRDIHIIRSYKDKGDKNEIS